MVDQILKYISAFLALIVVLPLHEYAHAFVAVKSGDNTPKLYGRYTLNPLAHFDILGLIFFAIIGFGWAKPVPVNPNNFKHYKRDSFLVSSAGVIVNYLLAFIVYPLLILAVMYVPTFGYFTDVLILTLQKIYVFSVSFFVFNLLPLYPLDGFRIYDSFSKRRSKFYIFLRKYSIYILYGLVFLGVLADITGVYQMDLLGNYLTKVVNWVSYPICAFWGLIF